MPKRPTDLDTKINIAVETWTSVHRREDAFEWTAWRDWLRDQLHCISEPENFTVPTPFPPSTIQAARDYIAVRRMIRSAIGWKDWRSKLPDDVYAYRAPGRSQ